MLNREYLRDLETIHQYNFKLAIQNFNSAKFALECDKDQIGGDPDMDEVSSLVKFSNQILADARELRLAASDLEATANGQFPYELDSMKPVCGEDPRDWFFDVLNIENCHNCPLHADMAKPNKHIRECGAKECIVRQLCWMIGHKV